jgi:hypothetical protein
MFPQEFAKLHAPKSATAAAPAAAPAAAASVASPKPQTNANRPSRRYSIVIDGQRHEAMVEDTV